MAIVGKRFRRSSIKVPMRRGVKKAKRVFRETVSYNSRIVPNLGTRNCGFPQTLKTRLKYCDQISITSGGGAINFNQFRMNGIFDPDASVGGHQPLYYDTYSQIYTKYRVLGSKLTCTFFPKAVSALPTTTGPWAVGVLGDDNGIIPTVLSTMYEANNNKHAILTWGDGGNNVRIMSVTYEPFRDQGLDPHDDTVGASVGGDPSNQWLGTPWIADLSGGTSSLNVKVELEYLVEFSKLATITGS